MERHGRARPGKLSARSLTLSHMARAVRRAREGDSADAKTLGPNQMQLYSFYKPSLQAANYVIEVTQVIDAVVTTNRGKETLIVQNTPTNVDGQEFEVMVPRFSLDADLVNSYYPPDGHQDEGRILPHVVFNDPHYPWEIAAGVTANMDGKIDPQHTVDSNGNPETLYRNMVPWVALVVFDTDDLFFKTSSEMVALNIPNFTTEADVPKQNPNGSFPMKVADYFHIPDSSRINFVAGYGNDKQNPDYLELTGTQSAVNVIFPTKDLFTQLFNDPWTDPADTRVPPVPMRRVEALKYLAHVRNINTVGFPDAGIEQDGLFSVIISSRTGPYKGQLPRTQVCHLVSIEHVDSTLGDYLTTAPVVSGRVAVISLLSWVYTALPPDPVNFVVDVRNITEKMQMLRTDDAQLATLSKSITNDGSTKADVARLMHARLANGYTLARWRTQTGEQTVAFNRGPLVPQPVTWPPTNDLPDCSYTSQDYQILDLQTGLMDLSYSSAWQVGKLLAISDTVFSSAIMRFRSLVHNSSSHQTRMEVNNMKTRLALLASIESTVEALLSKSMGSTGQPHRVNPKTDRSPAPALDHPLVKPIMLANIKKAVAQNAKAGQDFYNEFNLQGPNNTDWAVIVSWLADKLSLGGIPPQYLLPEPAYLPPESLRFFYIDDFWLDCLIDGALSVANHLDSEDDVVRREMKEVFNVYLDSVVPEAKIKPQIPCYGFILRSKVVKAMPDLKITVKWQVEDDRIDCCRWTQWDDETLMCLLDRQPEELSTITLAQPLHQSRFSLGSQLDTVTGLTFTVKQLYTQGPPTDAPWPERILSDPSMVNSWYNFDNQCLKLQPMGKQLNQLLQLGTATDASAYIDPQPNSCEFGMELSDKSNYFEIKPLHPDTPSQFELRSRQLYTRQTTPSASATVQAEQIAKGTTATKPLGSSKAVGVPFRSQQRPIKTLASRGPPHATPGKKPNLTSPSGGRPVPSRQLLRPPTAPHQQPRVQPMPVQKRAADSHASRHGTVTTLKSKFNLTIFADYKHPFTRTAPNKFVANDFVPTNNVYFFDLIFNVRKNEAESDSQYQLLKIAIDIPTVTDPPPKTLKTEGLLTFNYDGPGLRMLSNQRFIPFLFHDDDVETGTGISGPKPTTTPTAPQPTPPVTETGTGTMHIELIPRSTNDGYALEINDKRTTEMAFRLAEANVAPITVWTPVEIVGQRDRAEVGLVKVFMTEWYATSAFPQGEPVQSPACAVVKLNVTDDPPM